MKSYCKLYCKKKNIDRDGKSTIYLAIRIGMKEKLISTGKHIEPNLFSNAGKGGINNKREHGKLNTYLQNEKNRINEIILDLQYKNEDLTFDKILKRYEDESGGCFIKFAEIELENLKSSVAKRPILITKLL